MRTKAVNRLLLAVLSSLLLFHLTLLWMFQESVLGRHSDFAAFYAAAKLVERGSGSDLYKLGTQEEFLREFLPQAGVHTGPLFYYHPPFEVWLFLPLASLPYGEAFLVWLFINLLLLTVYSFFLAPHVRELWHALPAVAALAGISLFPVFVSLLQGQDSILLLFLLGMAFILLKRKRPVWAGCLMALGLFKLHIIVPFLFAFLVTKKWKVVLGFSIVALLLVLASVPIVGWQGIIDYPVLLWQLNQGLGDETTQHQRAIYPSTMPNVRGFFLTALAGWIPGVLINGVVFLSSAFLLLWSASKWARGEEGQKNTLALTFSLSLLAALLVSFHLHLHDMSLLALPILLTLNHWLSTQGDCQSLTRTGLVKVVMLFFLTPLYLILLHFGQLNLLSWVILAFALAISSEISWFVKKTRAAR